MNDRNVIGIDIGKEKLNYCLLSGDGEIIVEGQVRNSKQGFGLLYELIQKNHAEIIFEATGVYSRRWQYFLEFNEAHYVRMNPLAAKKEMDELRNTKNDKIDAKKLAVLQLRKKHAPTVIEDDVYQELRRQGRFYSQITQDCADAKNRLQKVLEETFYTLHEVAETNTKRFYELAIIFPHVDLLKDKSIDEIFELIQSVTGYSKTKYSNAKQLKKLADTTCVAVRADSSAVNEVQYLAAKVLELTALKEKIISEMLEEASDLEEVNILASIPGIGKQSAVTLIAEIGDIRRFKTPQKLNAFIGIDLRFSDSGKVKTSGVISKRGSGEARRQLYQIFQHIHMTDRNDDLKLTRWYNRRTLGMKGGKKKVIVGGMDRTLRLIYHLVMHDEYFDLAKQI
ncbi:IS110 family transposase [Weissella minor]|uniref:IS110 family transposase n=1 Tax=Weissella minor TaxID=1620 RepID=UPI001BAEECA4|nr:IS110 family transposase [Weissella minor]MBS0949198.1 IS110 family transposase [Weissella minor]